MRAAAAAEPPTPWALRAPAQTAAGPLQLQTPWIVANRPRRWEDFRGDPAFLQRFRETLLGAAPLPPTCALRLAVLHGKPGRGKTTLGQLAARECALAETLNASDERRGEDLRARLQRFLDDGARRGAAWLSGKATPSPPPLCLLFLDEADGLGQVGQLTVLSFLENLEDAPCRGWTPRVLLACNDVGAMHASLLSRADVCLRMPRPAASHMRHLALAVAPAASVAALPAEVLGSGDYRLLMQTLEVSTAGAGAGPDAAAAAGTAGAALPGLETSEAPPPALVRLLLQDRGAPFDPSRHAASERHVAPALRTLRDLWAQGHRADMLARWVETLLPEACAAGGPRAARASRLLRFRAELLRCAGRITASELQVFGAYVRAFQMPLPGDAELDAAAVAGTASFGARAASAAHTASLAFGSEPHTSARPSEATT
jgi:hypothetical protein